MGTPQFAVPSLHALAQGPYVITVVTQPDRAAGRGGKITPPPVKVAAQEYGLTVIQPETLKDKDLRAKLAELRPAVTVLVAYGEYIAPALLDMPEHGSINLHPSLLPRWRGSTPIQSAILAGDHATGVSIIKMDKGLDTGPIIAQRSTPIEPEESHPQLAARLAQIGADLLAETLPAWLRGEVSAVPQGEEGALLTHTLKKEDGQISWSLPAEEIARMVRAFLPWPGTYTTWQGRTLKVVRARLALPETPQGAPGTISLMGEGRDRVLIVQTGDGSLQLLDVQPEGKPVMEARALLAGYPHIVGSTLGAT